MKYLCTKSSSIVRFLPLNSHFKNAMRHAIMSALVS